MATLAAFALAERLSRGDGGPRVDPRVTPDATSFELTCPATELSACVRRFEAVLRPDALAPSELVAAHRRLRGDRARAVADETRAAQAAALRALFGAEAPQLFPLGEEQQAWLRRTLQESDAPFKLVFSHQVVGGNSDYGRGGRPQLENGSYEMGGTGPDGRPAFAEHRPGWPQPLHELLRDTGVTAFVHGHDHAFVFEEPLDGVAYITAPQPGSADYDIGHIPRSGYDESATVIGNSGYLLFRTTPQGQLEMSYVRIRLPGDGVPRETAFQHAFERR